MFYYANKLHLFISSTTEYGSKSRQLNLEWSLESSWLDNFPATTVVKPSSNIKTCIPLDFVGMGERHVVWAVHSLHIPLLWLAPWRDHSSFSAFISQDKRLPTTWLAYSILISLLLIWYLWKYFLARCHGFPDEICATPKSILTRKLKILFIYFNTIIHFDGNLSFYNLKY